MSSSTTGLDSTMTASGLIVIPDSEIEDAPEAGPSKPAPRPLRQERLYVGNLHTSVDEYALIKAFERFGKITSLDFLFHKAGPQKGKPRGYAFIEYSNKDEALKAMVTMHDKLVRGRNLVVTFAHQAPPLDEAGRLGRRKVDPSRPTALSLLKNQGKLRTNDKIAVLERKLAQMAKDTPTGTPPSQPPQPIMRSGPSLPLNHGLPQKPPDTTGSVTRTTVPTPDAGKGNMRRLKAGPPDLKTLMEMQKKEKERAALSRGADSKRPAR